MEYSYVINNKIIIVIVVGILIAEEVALMGIKIRIKALNLNCKIIFDFTNAKNQMTIANAYYWFLDYYDNVDMKFRYIQTAHLSNEQNEAFFKFVETTCNNKGILIRMFKEKKEALLWFELFR